MAKGFGYMVHFWAADLHLKGLQPRVRRGQCETQQKD